MNKNCNYCDEVMIEVSVVAGGGIWLCQSREFLENYVQARRSILTEVAPMKQDAPLICVVGNSGYLYGEWPKEGLFCEKCRSVVIKCQPY